MVRFFSGCLGAFIGVVIGVMCAFLYGSEIGGNNTFGAGLYAMGASVISLPLGAVLGAITGLRVLRFLQSNDGKGANRRKKAALITGIVLGITAIVFGLDWAEGRLAAPPSDDVMLAHFRQSKAALDRVVQMAQADKGLDRVSYDWTDPTDPQKIGVSAERIGEYRQLLDSAGVHDGFQRDDTGGEIDFYYWGQGSAISSDTFKGFAYLEKPPSHTLSSLDGCGPDEKNGVEAYRHIIGHWYLYYKYLPG